MYIHATCTKGICDVMQVKMRCLVTTDTPRACAAGVINLQTLSFSIFQKSFPTEDGFSSNLLPSSVAEQLKWRSQILQALIVQTLNHIDTATSLTLYY